MKQRLISGLLGVAATAVALGACPQEAYARRIPEWARKYRTSCATCHEAFPRLNAMGEAFRLNGFRFPQNDELYVEVEPVEMGAEAYKDVFPDAIWPSDIPGMPPISLRWKGDLLWDIGGEDEGRTIFNFPGEAALLAGGPLGDSMSFYTELGFEGGGGHGGGVELGAYLNVEDILSESIAENAVNFRIGTIGMQEMDLPGSRDHQRIGRVPYLKNTWMVPYPLEHFGPDADGNGKLDYGYNEANAFTLHHQPGVMLYGFGDFWKYAVGVVNGTHAEVNHGDFEVAHFGDNNSEKDAFFQLAFKIGGMGYDGSLPDSGEASEDLGSTPSGGWVDNSLQIGFFGYFGDAAIVGRDHATGTRYRTDDSFWRMGTDLRGKYEDVALTVGTMWGHHEDPYGYATSGDLHSFEWLAEFEWFALPWLIPTVRFEHLGLSLPHGLVNLDDAAAMDGDPLGLDNPIVLARDQDIARLVFELNMLMRANVKVSLFGIFYTDNDPRKAVAGGEVGDDNLIGVRFDFAF